MMPYDALFKMLLNLCDGQMDGWTDERMDNANHRVALQLKNATKRVVASPHQNDDLRSHKLDITQDRIKWIYHRSEIQ